jgi:hypothetical protein
LEKFEYGLVFKALKDLNEAKKNRGAFLFFSFFVFSFLIFSFFFIYSFFPSLFSSSSFLFFYSSFLCSSELLGNIALAIAVLPHA